MRRVSTGIETPNHRRAQDRFLRLGCQSQAVVTSSMRVKSLGPELAESAAAVNATKRQHVFGTRLAPKHARLFAPGADYGFAARLDHSGTDKEAFLTESAILHAGDIADEVTQLFFHRLGLRLAGAFLTDLSNELFDLVVEQPLGPAS